MISVFKDINKFAGKWKWLDASAIFCARYLIYAMMIFLLAIGFYKNNFSLFFYCLLAGLFSAFVIAKIIYFFYKEKRPAELPSSNVLIPVPKNPSFPSGHASFIFGFSFLLLFFNWHLGIFFLILSLIVGIARVFCGVHWFHDILGGAAAGFLSGIIIYYLITAI